MYVVKESGQFSCRGFRCLTASKNAGSNEKEYRTYSIEELRGMSIKQILNLNGLGTLRKNPPKAVQITGQGQPKVKNSQIKD
jgi:hypothetical protein